MSYKQNTAANRDALFGGPASGGGGKKPSSSRGGGGGGGGRPAPSSTTRRAPAPSSTAPPPSSSSSGAAPTSSTSRRIGGGGRTRAPLVTTLSGSAKLAKMKEAEEFRDKAKKAMSKGLFQKPDPVRAGTYYKRAADCYKQCGENRLERLHRIASGDCQMSQDAYSTAAAEYTRAAELSATSGEEESSARKQKEANQLHKNAADAWLAMGERGRAAESWMNAAFGLRIDVDEEEIFDRATLAAMEEAIEAFVPDLLNRQASHRKTKGGVSGGGGTDDDAPPLSPEQKLEAAKEDMVKAPYAHEDVQKMMVALARSGEYESALYAAGAACALLEGDGVATISLSRAYVTETILELALGDVVAADRTFMDVHLQNTGYLSSRECKLAEDLIRAIKTYDHEALESCQRDRTLANLDPAIRQLVQTLRVSGTAKKAVAPSPPPPPPTPASSAAASALGALNPFGMLGGAGAEEAESKVKDLLSPPPPSTEVAEAASPQTKELHGEDLAKALEENYNELDQIMGDMGLEDSEEEEEEDDDDDIDLR